MPLARRLSLWTAAALLALWLVGCWRYTSLGFEQGRRIGDVVREDFYRLRWPGDGTVMVGRGHFYAPADTHPLDRFDLGGLFFQPARENGAGTVWHGWGFKRLALVEPANSSALVPWQSRHAEDWWAAPGWLPGVLALLLHAVLARRPAAASPTPTA